MMGMVVVVIVMIRLWWWWWWDCDDENFLHVHVSLILPPPLYIFWTIFISLQHFRGVSREVALSSQHWYVDYPTFLFSEITYPRTASKILTFLLFTYTYFNAFTFWIQLFLLSSANGWVRLKNNMLDLYRYLRTWWQLITAARPACINMLRSCMGYFRNRPKFRTGGKLMIVRC